MVKEHEINTAFTQLIDAQNKRIVELEIVLGEIAEWNTTEGDIMAAFAAKALGLNI